MGSDNKLFLTEDEIENLLHDAEAAEIQKYLKSLAMIMDAITHKDSCIPPS